MYVLPKQAAPHQRVRYGLYVARNLRRGGFEAWATLMTTAALLVRERARAWEDAEAEAYGASADRDAADRSLDTTAQNTRAHLAGRSKSANKEKPYTQIFPDGVIWYTTSPMPEQVSRYTLFVDRLQTFLPEGDPARAAVGEVEAGINQYKAGIETKNTADNQAELKAQQLEEAERAFDSTAAKVFGLLAAHFESRTEAEKFYP